MEEDIIEEDELLPEIEIREYITIDEMIEFNPKFIAFNEEELESLFKQLLNKNPKAFLKIHSNIIKSERINVIDYIKPTLDVSYNNYDDLSEILDEYERINRAANYSLQKYLSDKNSLPYIWDVNNTKVNFPIIDKQYEFMLNTNKHNYARFLSFDKSEKLSLIGARWKPLLFTKDNFISETAKYKKYPYIKVSNKDINEDLNRWLIKYVTPSLVSILQKNIKYNTSIHDIRSLLSHHGIIFDNLEEKDFQILSEYLESIIESNIEDTEVKNRLKLKKRKWNTSNLEFWDILKSHYKSFVFYKNSENKKALEDKIANYIAILPRGEKSKEPLDVYKFAQSISSNDMTHAEIIEIIKNNYLHILYLLSDNLFKSVTAFKLPEDDKDIDKEKELFEKTNNSILLESRHKFIDKFTDLSEIVEGNNTNLYDGSPFAGLDNVFEETKNEFIELKEEEQLETEYDPEFLIEDEFETYPALLDCNKGCLDILSKIVPQLKAISIASGLPIDINSIIYRINTYVVTYSRVEELTQKIQDLPEIIARRIISCPTIESSLEYIKQLMNVNVSQALETLYPTIYINWEKNCKTQLKLALTMWWLDLIEMSLFGNLNFSILSGMIEYADLWSPFGLPVEESKQNTQGIFYYITAVTTDVLSSIPDKNRMHLDTLRKDIIENGNKIFKDKIEELKERWVIVKNTSLTKDKAKKVKDKLTEVINAIQTKKPVNNALGTYVESYLYLPTLLPNSGTKRRNNISWGQGCCLININDDYSADKDWKKDLIALWRLKQGFAKTKWSTSKRGFLKKMEKDDVVTKKEEPEVIKLKKLDIVLDDVTNDKTIISNDNWLPEHYNKKLKAEYEGNIFAKEILEITVEKLYGHLTTKKQKLLQNAIDIIIKDVESVIRNISYITLNLQRILLKEEFNTVFDDSLKIIKEIKGVLNNLEYTNAPIVIYAFACILALPGQLIDKSIIKPINNDIYQKILNENYDSIVKSITGYEMLSKTDIQEYITSQRELQKEEKLNFQDELSNEDRKILGDLKRFKLTNVIDEAMRTQKRVIEEQADEAEEMNYMNDDRDADRDDENL